METNYEKHYRHSDELSVGDNLSIGGRVFTVIGTEDVFHYQPNSRVRISLTEKGSTSSRHESILFLPAGFRIEILK